MVVSCLIHASKLQTARYVIVSGLPNLHTGPYVNCLLYYIAYPHPGIAPCSSTRLLAQYSELSAPSCGYDTAHIITCKGTSVYKPQICPHLPHNAAWNGKSLPGWYTISIELTQGLPTINKLLEDRKKGRLMEICCENGLDVVMTQDEVSFGGV